MVVFFGALNGYSAHCLLGSFPFKGERCLITWCAQLWGSFLGGRSKKRFWRWNPFLLLQKVDETCYGVVF